MAAASGYIDFFAELDEEAQTNDQLQSMVPEELRGIYWSNTPPIRLPNGKLFYHCRVPESEFETIQKHPMFHDNIVGREWQELWSRPYVNRDHIFCVAVQRRETDLEPESEFITIRVPISDLRESDVVKEPVARPWGIFAGDSVPEFPLEARDHEGGEDESSAASAPDLLGVAERIDEVVSYVEDSNNLDADTKGKIVAYLLAARALANSPEPDINLLRQILEKLRLLAKRIGESYITQKILELIDLIGDLL